MENKPFHVRWMIDRDLPEVLDIENESFENPWSKKDFIRCRRQKNCIGMVTENEECKIVGSMVYELHKSQLHLLNFAVHPDHRKIGVDSEMVDILKGKLSYKQRNSIMLEVRETNLAAQLFFRENGFGAKMILRDFYDDTKEDAYLMQYRLDPVFAPNAIIKNRITGLYEAPNRVSHRMAS